jgi:hypothetical protein
MGCGLGCLIAPIAAISALVVYFVSLVLGTLFRLVLWVLKLALALLRFPFRLVGRLLH